MLPVARLNDKHACPSCGVNVIVTASGSGKADNMPIACVGDKTACGAVIITGSSVSAINGKQIAYLGSTTSHGGKIISGSPIHRVQP